MYQNCCKKCGSIALHTEVKGNNTGLYCDDCGAWVKWLGKDELRAFEHANKDKCIVRIPEEGVYLTKEQNELFNNMVKNLGDFIQYLDEKIDLEFEKMPISNEDAIRKSAYCLGLQQDKWALENILQGKKWSDTE